MAATIKELQAQMLKENLDKYATEAEKRTKLAMAAIEGKADGMSATGKAYFEMLAKTVEASEKATGKQLKYSTDKINDISKTIQQASDLNDVERDLLRQQVETVQETFRQNTQNGSSLVSMAKKTLEDNAVDVTSIVAGLTSNNPVIMFATKWIGDSIKQRREEAQQQRQAIDEAMASVDTTLIAQREDNNNWRAEQETANFAEEENRREEARAREDQTQALEAIANKDSNVEVAVEGAEGDSFLDDILGGILGKGGLAGLATKFGPMLAKALPIAAIAGGIGMAAKDGFDMYSSVMDDDIATGLEGEDVGAVAGSAIGGAIGFALGGPIGAGIGAMVGNIAGEFIGKAIDPDMDKMAQDTANQIRDRQQALIDTMNVLETQLANGTISQEQYNAARAEMQAEIDKVNAQAIASDRVFELQAARDRAANAYNDLNTQIQAMEDAGLSVPQAMYDQLDVAEQSFYDAEAAFDTATDELNSQVDPSWWDSLSATVSSAVTSVTTSVDNAFTSVRNSLTGLAIPDIEGMSEEDRAALQAKVDALPAGLESAAGLTQEQLVLLAEDLEISPEDLAAMDSAAVLRATTMDSVKDGVSAVSDFATDKIGEISTGISAVGDMAGEALGKIEDALWSGAEAIGVDDELQAVGEYVGNLVNDVTEGAREYWNNFKDTMSDAKASVLSFFGFGDDEEEPELETETESVGDDSSNLVTEEAASPGNFDVSELMSLRQLRRGVNSDNISLADLERQKELLDYIDEENGGLGPINRRKMRLVQTGLNRAQYAEDILSGAITETMDIETGESVPVSQAQYDYAASIADKMGIEVGDDEYTTDAPTVGQLLNSTQAETEDLQAVERSGGNAGGSGAVVVAPSTTNNVGIQRVTPITPVRNSSDDYRGSAVPAQ